MVRTVKWHVEAGISCKDLFDTLPVEQKAVGYMADALAESVRTSARSLALVNLAQRALWVKTWSGHSASKVQLCGLPFEGHLMFGHNLDAVLDRMVDKNKTFPGKKKITPQVINNFTKPRIQRRQDTRDPGGLKGVEEKLWCSVSPASPQKNSDDFPTCGRKAVVLFSPQWKAVTSYVEGYRLEFSQKPHQVGFM